MRLVESGCLGDRLELGAKKEVSQREEGKKGSSRRQVREAAQRGALTEAYEGHSSLEWGEASAC